MKNCILLSLFLFPCLLLAQQRQITGQVLSEKDRTPLTGAIIALESGVMPATVTDGEGNFKITAPASETHVLCKFLGYTERRIAIPMDDKKFTILMAEQVIDLDAVEVVEYKRPLVDKTSSVGETISKEEIQLLPTIGAEPTKVIAGGIYCYNNPIPNIKATRTEVTEYYIDDGAIIRTIAVNPVCTNYQQLSLNGVSAEYETSSAIRQEKTELGWDEPIKFHDKNVNIQPAVPIERESAGILTAGEVNDFAKWELWQDIAGQQLAQYQQYWQIQPLQRYTVQLVNEQNLPVVNVLVRLKNIAGEIIWEAKSDNTGKAELWRNLFDDNQEEAMSLEVVHENGITNFAKPQEFKKGVNLVSLPAPCTPLSDIDVAFVVDATGSMQDEIDYLQAEMGDVVRKFSKLNGKGQVRIGSVFYRDQGDAYVTRSFPFSHKIGDVEDFLFQQYAAGGGDEPEAVDQGLQVAIEELAWNENAKTRIIFLLLDAPPHNNPEVLARLRKLTTEAARKGIRIVPIGASGTDRSTEYLMRSMALATNGTYLFLTDHSGVGNAHIEAITDEYDVELLNAALLRIMQQFSKTESCESPIDTLDTSKDTAIELPLVGQDSLPNVSGPIDPEPAKDNFQWKYYPNPSSGIFYVEMDEGPEEIFVADLNGKILLRALTNKQHKVKIDLTGFPRGMYLIKFEHEGKLHTGKLVKIASAGATGNY